MEKNNLIEKAILQILTEEFGFEDSKTYWNLLSKKELNLSKNKKYRIFKDLFRQGLLLKIRKKNLFEYIPVPPTFIYLHYQIDHSFLIKKEEEYFRNYGDLFINEKIFLETTGGVIDGIIIFILKYFMKKESFLVVGGYPVYNFVVKNIDANKLKNIKLIGIEEAFKGKDISKKRVVLKNQYIISDRRFCIIDDKILFSLYKTFEDNYFGYITSNLQKISIKKKEFDFLYS